MSLRTGKGYIAINMCERIKIPKKFGRKLSSNYQYNNMCITFFYTS